ncbi:MAG: hypothetical protein ACLQIB_44060 [Isosphaeraceae bacterium]
MSASARPSPDVTDLNWKRAALAGAGIGLLLALIRSGSVTEREFGSAFWILAAWLAVMAVSVPLVAILATRSFSGFAFCLLLVTLLWNVATLALLPWVIQTPERFATAVKTGIRQSWRWKWRWFPLVIAQLLLLGAMTYYTRSGGGSNSWSFNVHNPWIGGYACQTNWYADYAAWLKAPESPFAVALLSLALLTLAVAVKISIIADVQAKPESAAIPDAGPVQGGRTRALVQQARLAGP